MNAPTKTEDAFHQLIHQNHMWGLWEIASQMTPQPRPEAIPYQWKWSLLKEVVKRSASAVPVGDERRAMQLFNPGLNGQWATTNTLIAAVQVLLPGEVARAHRHSPAAIWVEYGATPDDAVGHYYSLVTTWFRDPGPEFFNMVLCDLHLVRQGGDWKIRENRIKGLYREL